MKLSELTTCIRCDEAIVPIFYRITVEQIMIDTSAVNQVVGLTQMLGGSMRLAEVFASHDDVTVTLQEASGLVCQNCFVESEIPVAILFKGDEE